MKQNNGRLWATICDAQVEIRSLTMDKLEASLDVLESFYKKESVCVATKINLPENIQARQELNELCRITASDGVSLIALEKSTGKPIAVAFNKIQFIPDNDGEDVFFVKFRNEMTKSPNAQALMDFMIDVDNEFDVFKKFDLDCTCELTFLATLPQWERKGIGKALAKYTIDLAKELRNGKGVEDIHPTLRSRRPQAVTALFTSAFSQAVGRAVGFRVLNTMPYNLFSFEGKSYDQRVDPLHKACQHVIFLL